MEKNLNASQRRAMQYWFADGLAELSGGLIGLLLAVFFIVLQVFPSLQAGFGIIYLVIFVAGFGIRKLMLWMRERTTYPRSGFVEPKQGWENRWLLAISIGFTVLLLGFLFYMTLRGIQTFVWIPAISGIIFAFIFFLAGYRTRLMRFIYLAVFCLLLGFLLAVSGVGDYWGAGLLSLVTSLVLFAFGSVTRAAYLQQTRVIRDQANGQ